MANNKYVLTIDGTDYRFQAERDMGNYKLNLEKLSYDKGIYRPAEMKVTMNVSGQNVKNSDLVSAFHQKIVKLTVDGETVADDYFVFKVMPVFKKVSTGSSVKLELTIFSLDKLLALDKYSKAWSDKKLGVDIFSKEVDSFNLGLSVCSDLQVVDYGSGEFIQPYLVQYNESFYDFMRRTANRCGEFLYHENGQLHLGMQMSDKAMDKDPDYAQIASERHYENLLSDGVETTDYAYDYLNGHSWSDKTKKPYSNPLTYDDYLDDVSEVYTTWQAQMDYLSKNLINTFSMILGSTSLADILGNGAASEAFRMTQCIVSTQNLNDKHMKGNITPWDGKNDQKSGDKLRQFGTIKDQRPKNDFSGKDINMNAGFYALMREAEKKVGENAVYLEFGDATQKLSIGDKIKVDGECYVVIGVNGSCDFIYTDDSKKATYEERQQVIGVKLYGEAAIPPALPDIVIRESQPQLAFVIDNFDPEKLGRVRVKFAWQPEEGKDNKENASPWIRVSLPFASDGAGVKFKPENGDEVMVSFEEGNVERPYVSGFLLSPKSNETWSWLPDRSITSKNGHTLTFNDGVDGSNFIQGMAPALKLLRSYVPTAAIPPLFSDFSICRGLTGGMTLSDRFGLYKINLSSDSRSVLIQSAMGNVTLNAFTGITISAPSGDIKIQGKNIKLEASDKVTIESGTAVKQRFLPGETPYTEAGYFWNSAPGRWIADIGLTFLRGVRNRVVDKAIDVSLIRTAIDVFLRPIDGTTKIKSSKFIQIEAGKGSTEYPRDAREDKDKGKIAPDLYYNINSIASVVRDRVETIQTRFTKLCEAITAFNVISGEKNANANECIISFNSIKDASSKAATLTFNWDQFDLGDIPTEENLKKEYDKQLKEIEDKEPKMEDDKYNNLGRFDALKKWDDDFSEWKKEKHRIKVQYNKALEDRKKRILEMKKPVEDAANNLKKAIYYFYKTTNELFNMEMLGNDSIFYKACNTALGKMKWEKLPEIKKDMSLNAITNWKELKKHYMRKAVCLFLSDPDVADKVNFRRLQISAPSATVSQDNLDVELNWQNLINSMVSDPKLPKTTNDKMKEWEAETYYDVDKQQLVNRNRWKVGVEGKILFSDNSEKTMTFDKNGLVKTTDNVTFTDKSYDQLKIKLGSIGTNVE